MLGCEAWTTTRRVCARTRSSVRVTDWRPRRSNSSWSAASTPSRWQTSPPRRRSPSPRCSGTSRARRTWSWTGSPTIRTRWRASCATGRPGRARSARYTRTSWRPSTGGTRSPGSATIPTCSHSSACSTPPRVWSRASPSTPPAKWNCSPRPSKPSRPHRSPPGWRRCTWWPCATNWAGRTGVASTPAGAAGEAYPAAVADADAAFGMLSGGLDLALPAATAG